MIDRAGNTLEAGDKVAYTEQHDDYSPRLGIVTGFTPCFVRVEPHTKVTHWDRFKGKTLAKPDRVLKLDLEWASGRKHG